MHINPIYKKIGQERREYRKYAPWIFLGAESILVFEILYTTDLFISLGNLFLIGFIGVMYFRFNKFLKVLERNKKLKPSSQMNKFMKKR